MRNYEVIDVEQRSQEWLDLRSNLVGASDAPVIMEENPWKTRYQLWQEKLAIKENNFSNANTERGVLLEDQARECFIRKTGVHVKPLVVKSNVYPWMLSSYDGVDSEHKIIVEIKCPGKKVHEMGMNGIVPSYYLAQLMHQMLTLGLEKCFYFSYDPESSNIIEVDLNTAYAPHLLESERHFYYKNMLELEAPELVDKDYVLKNDLEWSRAASEWKDTNLQLQYLKKKEDDLRKRLIGMCDQSNCMGSGIKMSKIVRKGVVDYKAIPELKDIDVDKYRKSPVETWRINQT
jgi:putative phage-type endonuclease